MHVEAMRAQGANTGSVDLRLTQQHDRLVIGLFEPEADESEFHPGSTAVNTEVELRRVKQGKKRGRGTLFDVVTSCSLDLRNQSDELDLDSHNLVAIGGSRTPDREAIDPTLTYGAGLGGWRTHRDTPFFTYDVIGYAVMNGITVLEQGMTPDVA